MAQYKCENCNALRDTPVCPKCGADTHPVEPSLDELAASMSRKAAVAEATAPKPAESKPAPAAPSKPATAPSTAPKPAPPSPTAPKPAPPSPTAPKPAASSAPSSAPKPAPAASAPPKPSTPPPPRATEPPRETPASTAPQPPRPATPPRPRVVPTPPATEEKGEGALGHQTPSKIVGLEEFHAILEGGSKAVIICGNSGSGKSEIAYGYIRANALYRGKSKNLNLAAAHRSHLALGATNPDSIWYQPIDHRRIFLDPSGEFFQRLSPAVREKLMLPPLADPDFEFVRKAAQSLLGIVLVVDLTSALDEHADYPWLTQEEDLTFVLSALRWLHLDKEARPQAIEISTNINRRVDALPRIDKRVLVLFSKADQLPDKYRNQNPLEFARRRLPTLHSALMTHARRFRFDFCHTMKKNDAGEDQKDDPCGVLLPMNWLLEDKFRWLPLQLPTSWFGGGK